ncbi:hypothetical protein EJ110_NYTH28084 [Nymphaea thermarum]|nr:hypothetical protein EJ110_NYTH28084 [Nymphaea thermarum]
MGPLAYQTRSRPPPVEPYQPRAPAKNDSDSAYSNDDEFWHAHPVGPVDHRHRHTAEHPNRPASYGVRLDLLEFVGRFDAQEYIDWAYAVQFFFDYHQVEEHHRAWGEMQRLMQTKFVPSDHAEWAYKEYLNLRQGSRSVADYTAEFHRLSLHVQIVETERQQVPPSGISAVLEPSAVGSPVDPELTREEVPLQDAMACVSALEDALVCVAALEDEVQVLKVRNREVPNDFPDLVPEELVPALEEFTGTMPAELSRRLPHQCEVDHASRRSLGHVSVPVWLIILSDQLLIIAISLLTLVP